MLLRIALLLAIALATKLTLVPAASAQQSPPELPAKPLPSDADLDTLVTTKNWRELSAVLEPDRKQDDFFRKLSWLRGQVNTGGGLLLTLAYIRSLWTLSSVSKESDSYILRHDAALMALYAIELVVIDGSKCEDRSAPDRRVHQVAGRENAALEFIRRQPSNVRAVIVDQAIAFEEQTAPIREDDELICRGGLAEIQAGLKRGQQTPGQPGILGKSNTVTQPPDWIPKFVAPEVYRPMQAKARAGMRENLLRLISPPS